MRILRASRYSRFDYADLLALTLRGSDWLLVSLNQHQSTRTHHRTSRLALDFKVSLGLMMTIVVAEFDKRLSIGLLS